MKARTIAACQECGAQMPRWVGRCPECGAWGTVVEETVARPPAAASQPLDAATRPLADHEAARADRLAIGLEEVDLVLGGGLMRASIVLLAGEPGVGKSTLTLQAALALAREHEVLLVCGEEGPEQVRSRAERIGEIPDRVRTLGSPSLPTVLAAMEERPTIVVVDSIQSLYDPEISSAPGSVVQVRECGAALARAARERGVTVVLVGHVTKEGTVAGPRVLEHLVDVVLAFEGDRSGGVRILRPLKNRFGSTDEVGFFEMTHDGLVPIRDASRYLLADRHPGLPGSVLAACVEGRRPFVLEIQALVEETKLAMPRRTALGVDTARLPVLVAVLQRKLRGERRLGAGLGGCDVFVSAVGGIRVQEPAADLPVAMAILSAALNVALPDDVVAFGEVGLAGEIRRVQVTERRLVEARSIGCRRAVVPRTYTGSDAGLELIPVRELGDVVLAIDQLAQASG